MKKLLTYIASVLALVSLHANDALIVEGKYQSKNIYVQNAFSQNGVGFCAYEVYVNNVRTSDEVGSSAFEIDLRPYNLQPGDPVTIQIYHKDGCMPKILNPEALKPRPTFATQNIEISLTGMLTWTTTGESGSLPFVIEQFRWNKWVYVGEVQGTGKAGPNTYNFQVTAHSGENQFRVKQAGFGKEVKYSPVVRYTPSDKPKLTFTQSKDSREVLLSGESLYEMYDQYGNVVLKGYGSKIQLDTFDKGTYYLCFDNNVVPITRK